MWVTTPKGHGIPEASCLPSEYFIEKEAVCTEGVLGTGKSLWWKAGGRGTA